jgi:hypothetical protein
MTTSMSDAADRRLLASHLARIAHARGWNLETNEELRKGCRTLVLQGPRLSVLVRLDGDRPEDVPLLHWRSDQYHIQPLTAAWQSVNHFDRRIATSYPKDQGDLILMLIDGIEAANDGSAFLIAND